MAKSTQTKQAFEPSLARLEEIVQQLEGGGSSLEDSLRLFEEGVALSRRCLETLGNAERKVEQLMVDSGKIEPFEPIPEDNGTP